MRIKNEIGEIVWKDKKRIFLLIFIPVLILFLFLIFNVLRFPYRTTIIGDITIILFLTIITLSLFGFILRKSVAVGAKGVRINNVKILGKNKWIHIKKRNIFIAWENIVKISIVNRLIGFSFGLRLLPFLIVKTKKNRIYQYSLQDSKGFLNALRRLDKLYLLTEKSKDKLEKLAKRNLIERLFG